ncbi:peptidase M23 family protein [Microlunatus phosphovorus NM-1]|uniref:Peptidase M23 family protein n=1 Tax=Microlunatus phosphovorus (strain ATCC 700054 / DSM 10555 / JCM 9379 / NBRC 101784 / NCIMB 13414 / VKM Ac-1990 / NM-1) TaxID=1032480 RepID=F5XLN5_MICPN|nr:M23 family metallopeptidase [Microlunatus phosphovorus]BAK36301.1 peptidase M23 family protein [Microlunatus phosphovorus NM-1]
MTPDLPYVHLDVPEGSEAPEHDDCFAIDRTPTPARRALVRWSDLTTRLRRATRHSLRLVAVVGIASTLALTLLVPSAKADDLTDRRDQVRAQQAAKKHDLNESSQALNAAANAVSAAESQLAAAQAALAQTRVELGAAERLDIAMAAKLKLAKKRLAKAKAAVAANQKKLDAEKKLAGQIVRDQYQRQTNLLPIAVLVESSSTADLQTRLQWSTTMFDTSAATIKRTEILQAKLDAEKAKQAAIEKEIAADRKRAADNLVVKRRLEAQATQQQASVASLLSQRQAAESQAAAQVARDKSDYAQLTRERANVEQRISARIARAKAAAARKAAAERAARVAAAKAAAAERARRTAEARRERAKQRAAQKVAAAASAAEESSGSSNRDNRSSRSSRDDSSSSSHSSGGSTSSASHGFSYPVNAPITSPYGMRFHPVLHYWKLHDGTDFGAGCGTPIRAPYSGKVVEKYYNAGYGNRLIIDHGRVDGRYVTTAYNHAIRYTVGVGNHVSKGEVIGYVGTTGYSTGCHLHLMVWLDGSLRNPMTWF